MGTVKTNTGGGGEILRLENQVITLGQEKQALQQNYSQLQEQYNVLEKEHFLAKNIWGNGTSYNFYIAISAIAFQKGNESGSLRPYSSYTSSSFYHLFNASYTLDTAFFEQTGVVTSSALNVSTCHYRVKKPCKVTYRVLPGTSKSGTYGLYKSTKGDNAFPQYYGDNSAELIQSFKAQTNNWQYQELTFDTDDRIALQYFHSYSDSTTGSDISCGASMKGYVTAI